MFNNLESVLLDDMIEKNWEKMEEEEKKAAAKSEEMEKAVAAKVSEFLPAIQEQERANARKVIREEYRLAEGVKIYGLSQFISESVTIDGEELFPNNFIPDRPVNESISEDNPLYFDDKSDVWRLFVKNGKLSIM